MSDSSANQLLYNLVPHGPVVTSSRANLTHFYQIFLLIRLGYSKLGMGLSRLGESPGTLESDALSWSFTKQNPVER